MHKMREKTRANNRENCWWKASSIHLGVNLQTVFTMLLYQQGLRHQAKYYTVLVENECIEQICMSAFTQIPFRRRTMASKGYKTGQLTQEGDQNLSNILTAL